ncbi:putative MFS family arabinose efflux permease [Cereibacter changlensis]|uniref:Putative MFS family arabinose efflux permease n=3 Tax=Cereibacter changlensis TaxID=402884 RepID=A0A2W7R3I6_9RHOB|nr:MFS transporter [Cereibacter changlensis]PZX48639.1 putative MFS family arabinose efflux permease [Cereibacter changlensis]
MPLPAFPARPFFGWHVVAATFVLATFGWGVGFYGPPVFLYAVALRTGWPVPMVSAAVTVHFLLGAAVVANLPRLYRSFGVPFVTVMGTTHLAIGIAGWALAAEPWQLFVAALASGSGWVTMGAAAVNALIAPWFNLRRPAALGMAYNGASLGGVIFSPLWIALIAGIGFVPASLAIGGVMLAVVGVLSVLVFRHTPKSLGQAPDGAEGALPRPLTAQDESPIRRQFFRDRRFLTLAVGMMLGLFAQIGLLAHLFSLLVPVLGEGLTGFAMGGATLAAILGRSLVGWVMPASADRRLVACASYGVQVIGSLLFIVAAGDGGPWLFLGIALFGLGIGNATSLPPLIAQQEFSPPETARVVPLIVAIGQAGYAFAPAAFGLLRAGGGAGAAGPTPLFVCAAAIQVAAIGCLLAGRGVNPSCPDRR